MCRYFNEAGGIRNGKRESVRGGGRQKCVKRELTFQNLGEKESGT